MDKNSIPLSLLKSLLEGPQRQNVDLAAIFAKADLDKLWRQIEQLGEDGGQSGNKDTRMSLHHIGPLLRSMWQAMDDEASGFLSRPFRTGMFSMMCHAIITAGNLRRALLRSARFIHLMTDDLALELQEKGDEAKLFIHYQNPHRLDPTFFVTSLFIIWIRLSCWLVSRPLLLERIYFEFDQPSYSPEFNLMFPCRHYFGQPDNAVVFSRRALDLPIVQDDQSLAGFLTNAPESLLTQFRADESLTAQIKRLLLHRHGMERELELMTFEAVSEELHMTSHTLRRRLKEEGNSFQEIKDSIRRDQAIYLLANPQLSIQDICMKLEFSEPAAFSRAFKKWTGMTPGHYREKRLVAAK